MAAQFWYCLKHGTVEDEPRCQGADRMGPYATRAEAENALQTAAHKTEQWDRDPEWNDDRE